MWPGVACKWPGVVSAVLGPNGGQVGHWEAGNDGAACEPIDAVAKLVSSTSSCGHFHVCGCRNRLCAHGAMLVRWATIDKMARCCEEIKGRCQGTMERFEVGGATGTPSTTNDDQYKPCAKRPSAHSDVWLVSSGKVVRGRFEVVESR